MSDLLGIPVAAICPREDDQRRLPIEGATPSDCCRCHNTVMVSPATRRRIRPSDPIICTDCAIAIAAARGQKWIDPGRNADQLDELQANGHEAKRFLFG
jgi:hypothetical protein